MNKMNKTLNLYFSFPRLTKMLVPIIFVEHLVTAFCLNTSIYFKKAGCFNFDVIGQFISVYYLGCFLGALIGGTLTLVLSSIQISGIGMICVGALMYCLFQSLNQWVILFSMLFIGLIGTIVATSNVASLIRSAPEGSRLKVISLELILFNLAFSLATFILLDFSLLKIVYFMRYFPFLLGLLGIVVLIFYQDPAFFPMQQVSLNIKSLLPKQKKDFFILISMVFCYGLIFSMVKVVFTPTLIERFGSNNVSASIASINPWLVFLFQPLVVDHIKNTNSTWYLGCGGLLVGLNFFAFGIVSSFTITLVILIALTVGEMMFSPLSKHLNLKLYGPGKEGIAAGLWRAVFLGSGVIGPQLSGYTAEHYGVYSVWSTCALLGLTCFIFSLFIKQREGSHPNF